MSARDELLLLIGRVRALAEAPHASPQDNSKAFRQLAEKLSEIAANTRDAQAQAFEESLRYASPDGRNGYSDGWAACAAYISRRISELAAAPESKP